MRLESSRSILIKEIASVVRSVCTDRFGMTDLECHPQLAMEGERITATVHLIHDWSGLLLVECSPWAAFRITAELRGVRPPIAINDFVRGAIADFAALVSRGFEASSSQPLRASLPCVIDGTFNLRLQDSEIWERVSFRCTEGPFWITLLAGTLDRKGSLR